MNPPKSDLKTGPNINELALRQYAQAISELDARRSQLTAELQRVERKRNLLQTLRDSYQALVKEWGDESPVPALATPLPLPMGDTPPLPAKGEVAEQTFSPTARPKPRTRNQHGGGAVHSPTPKGTISLRQAIIHVLREAGEPLHVRTIWQRAQAHGAVSAAKEPVGVVDLVARSIAERGDAPIVKERGARVWRWTGAPEPAA